MTSDAQLVEQSRHRDAAAFGALVARHQRLVFGVALARCGDPALAEDVAQEAFVTAWRDLDRLRDADRVGSWVAGIARNLAANAVRTRARRWKFAAAERAAPADTAPTPEDHALEREDRELLVRALAQIPAAYRETLVLFYVEGEAVARIAAALGVTEDVVKQRLSRGRRALQKSVAARVETALSRARPGPAFGAAVAAALTTAGARRAAAGKALMLMTGKNLAVIAGVLVLAIAGGAMLWHHASHEPSAAVARVAAAPAAAPSRATSHAPHVTKIDKAARDALIAAIRKAREARQAAPAPAASAPSSDPRGSAPALPDDEDPDRDYIKSCMQDLIPMITDCYNDALSRDPKIAGTVTVDFTIEGEPGVGGVVTNSAVVPDQSQITDPGMRECIEQTMYSLEIDPPANGGSAQVRYPFTFSSDGPPPKQ